MGFPPIPCKLKVQSCCIRTAKSIYIYIFFGFVIPAWI